MTRKGDLLHLSRADDEPNKTIKETWLFPASSTLNWNIRRNGIGWHRGCYGIANYCSDQNGRGIMGSCLPLKINFNLHIRAFIAVWWFVVTHCLATCYWTKRHILLHNADAVEVTFTSLRHIFLEETWPRWTNQENRHTHNRKQRFTPQAAHESQLIYIFTLKNHV